MVMYYSTRVRIGARSALTTSMPLHLEIWSLETAMCLVITAQRTAYSHEEYCILFISLHSISCLYLQVLFTFCNMNLQGFLTGTLFFNRGNFKCGDSLVIMFFDICRVEGFQFIITQVTQDHLLDV